MNIFLDIDDTLLDYNEVEKTGGYNNVPILPGVVQFVQRNLQQGHSVYIISWYNRDGEDAKRKVKEKYEWCMRNLPMIDTPNIFVVPMPSNKAKKAMEILGEGSLTKNDILIDDNEDNIKQWKEAGGMPFLFDKNKNSWKNL